MALQGRPSRACQKRATMRRIIRLQGISAWYAQPLEALGEPCRVLDRKWTVRCVSERLTHRSGVRGIVADEKNTHCVHVHEDQQI
jgi:hypothetical protein